MRESTAAKKLSTYFELLSWVGRTFFSCEISVRICPEIPYERTVEASFGGYSGLVNSCAGSFFLLEIDSD